MADTNTTGGTEGGEGTITIHFINNVGAGFADNLQVDVGTTMQQLFRQQMGKGAAPGDYLIRVNRNVVAASYILQNGDRVSVTPAKIKGARR